MILGIIIAAAVLAVDLITDYRLWLKKVPVNHRRGAILRVIGLAPAIFLIGYSSTLLVLSLYWLLFDGIYNVLRGFNWWFTGSDDPDDANTDNILQRLTLWQHIALKLGLVAGGILIVIL